MDLASMVMPKKWLYNWRYKSDQNGKHLNLENPLLFNEKLFWLLRYNELYNKKLIQEIYDKNKVRNYVITKGLEHTLIKQVGKGVYYSVSEIDWEALPEKFILKFSQGSHNTIICTDKQKLDIKECERQIKKWFKTYKINRKNRFDGYYFSDHPSIVCEELITDDEGNLPNDIKFFCSKGKVIWLYIDLDTIDENNKKKVTFNRLCYDTEWNIMPIMFCQPNAKGITLKKPDNFDELLHTASILSEDFFFARIDLYNIDENQVLFGEITPVPGMAAKIEPENFDRWLGDQIILPNVKVF